MAFRRSAARVLPKTTDGAADPGDPYGGANMNETGARELKKNELLRE